MSVEERIISIRLIEKLKEDPAFAELAGITYKETNKEEKDYDRNIKTADGRTECVHH